MRDAARRWAVLSDRGLTTAEAAELERWLSADPRHRVALEKSCRIWTALATVPVQSIALSEGSATGRPKLMRRAFAAGMAIAASLAIAYFAWVRPQSRGPGADETVVVAGGAEIRSMRLADGTTVYLGRNSEVLERFNSTERRVELVRGEAHFDVASNSAWPFVVRAGAVQVRAVGTAFNVSMLSAGVDVKVTEGTVSVTPDPATVADAAGSAASNPPLVEAGQRAQVAFNANAPTTVQVFNMSAAEMARAMAWQDPIVRLSTLAELADEFHRRTGRSVVLADAELRNLEFGGRFRGDDLEGFVGVLENIYGLETERTPDGGFILRKPR